MRTLAVFVLCGSVFGGPVEQLRHPDPSVRRWAFDELLVRGRAAWPELEPLATDADPDVRRSAHALLRAWGWLPPRHRAAQGLFDRDPVRRALTLRRLVESGADGLAAARDVFARATIAAALVPPPDGRAYTGRTCELRLRNESVHPGWGRLDALRIEPVAHQPFGRAIDYNRGRWKSWGQIVFGRFRQGAVNDARVVVWLEPGDTVAVRAHLPWLPGVYRLRARMDDAPRVVRFKRADSAAEYRFRNPVATAPSVEFHAVVLPPRTRKGLRLAARLEGDRLHVGFEGRGNGKIHRDGRALWYLFLGDDEVALGHGPLVPDADLERPPARRGRGQRAGWANRLLVAVAGWTGTVPRPPAPAGARRLVIGVDIDDDSAPHGRTLVTAVALP